MYAGLAPYEALALYAVITYMDSVEGVFVPEGGMHAMATGLAEAVEKAGADVRYDAPVTRILRDGGGAVTRRRARRRRARSMPTPWSATPTCRWPTARCSTASTRRAPPAAGATRRRACCGWPACGACRRPAPPTTTSTSAATGTTSFDALINDGTLMPDPSILVTLHSLDDPSLAPAGCSTLYVLEPVPNLDGRVDWTRERDPARVDAWSARSRRSAIRSTS